MDISVRVLKEPRGFIRVIEILMAIFAFSTTAGFSSSVSFKHKDCLEPTEYSFKYPFRFVDNPLEFDCENDNGVSSTIQGVTSTKLPYNFSSSAEFFVATGVLAFLYAGFSLSLYVFAHERYKESKILPVVDLFLSAIIAVFWLAGSSAWAEDVRNMKYFMDFQYLIPLIFACRLPDSQCTEVSEGHYATLNVSLILGFFNFVLWTAGLWFIFKETIFHQPAQSTEMPKQQTLGPRTGGHV